jgi:hypothetical protein
MEGGKEDQEDRKARKEGRKEGKARKDGKTERWMEGRNAGRKDGSTKG